MKTADCERCLFYKSKEYFICPIHPYGVHEEHCLDFRPEPNIEEEEKSAPEGYSYYGGELISNKPSRYTKEEQLSILDSHPFFTGVCPQCGYEFDRKNPPKVHWDCPSCGWIDDSV